MLGLAVSDNWGALHKGFLPSSLFFLWHLDYVSASEFDPSFICYLGFKSVIRVITGNGKANKPDSYDGDCASTARQGGCSDFDLECELKSEMLHIFQFV